MASTTARTPDEYIETLPPDRREAIARTPVDVYLAYYRAQGASRKTSFSLTSPLP